MLADGMSEFGRNGGRKGDEGGDKGSKGSEESVNDGMNSKEAQRGEVSLL